MRFPLARLWGPRKARRLCGERRSSVVIELSCLHGSERYAACFDEVVARAVRVSQPAVLSALLVIQLFGIVISPPYFPQRAPKGALRPFTVAALLHYVLWCASEYSVVGRISCHVSYDNIETNVCQWLFAENFLSPISLLNRFHQQFRISTFDDNNRITATNILMCISA